MFVATSLAVNVSAATATVGLYLLTHPSPNPYDSLDGIKVWAILIVWIVSPYAVLSLMTLRWRRAMLGSIVVLLGTLIVAGFGCFITYASLAPYINAPPPSAGGPMNCGPPIHLAIPVVQWIAVIVVAISARLTNALASLFWPAERRIIVTGKPSLDARR